MGIKQLSSTATLNAGDNIALASVANGDDRRTPLSVLLAWLQANLVFTDSTAIGEYATQYAAPSSTGFNVTIAATAGENTHLILTPTAGFATGTITLPAVATCVDKQRVLVNCTQQVTALTLAGNGASAVTGAPASLGADDFFELKFDLPTQNWYRVG